MAVDRIGLLQYHIHFPGIQLKGQSHSRGDKHGLSSLGLLQYHIHFPDIQLKGQSHSRWDKDGCSSRAAAVSYTFSRNTVKGPVSQIMGQGWL